MSFTTSFRKSTGDEIFELRLFAFGSIYDTDLQYGERMTDGDSRDVYFQFEGHEIEYESMGQYSFEASEGDTVTVVDEREEGSGGWAGMVRTQIDWAATGDVFEIEEYANGTGAVLYREAGTQRRPDPFPLIGG